MNTHDLISINEAARRKGVSRQAIHAAIESERLACVEVLEPVRKISVEALAAFKPNPNMKRLGRKKSER